MMKIVLAVILLFIGYQLIGLFMSSKQEAAQSDQPPATIAPVPLLLGMVLLDEPNSLNLEGFFAELAHKWHLDIKNLDAKSDVAVFDTNGYHIAVANMAFPVPGKEVKETAKINYLWKNAESEIIKSKGHIILTLTNAGDDPIAENLLYSKLASSLMNNSKSMGIYMGGRTLVLRKDFYQDNVESMSAEDLPLFIWLYFGLVKEDRKQSIYTYGLADFGKKEMEILDSEHPNSELTEMMFNMVHYVIASDVELQDGETIGMSAEQKLTISESEGRYLEGITLKIAY